jgi:porphobilinogen deaminase
VHERERAAVRRRGLGGAPEAAQQLAARRVQVAVVAEREAVDDLQAGCGPSVSATATARLSSTTGESVSRVSSP